MRWNKETLDEALDEALRDGMALRAPEADDPRDTRALRQALYNRAGRRKLEGLEFAIEGTHVVVRKRKTQEARRVEG